MRIKRLPFLLVLAFLISNLTACSSGGGQASSESESKPKYNETKTMVLDILHSKEGRDTLKDMAKDPSIKSTLVVNEQDISTALIKTFNDEKNQKSFLQAQMNDPKFATAIVKASKKEHEQILRQLMKDPEYQQSMLTLMKSPDFQNMTVTLMQSPEYRQYIMKVMADSLHNPEFRLMYMDLVKEAIRTGAGIAPKSALETKSSQGGGKEGGGKEDGSQGDKKDKQSSDSDQQDQKKKQQDEE